ncbi:MAG: ExbD/TolR family protein [Planctomycetaceae bacterium]
MIDIVILLLIFLVCASAGSSPESMFPTQLAAGGAVSSAEVPLAEKKWVTPIWLHLKRGPGEARTIISMNERDYDDFDLLRSQLQTLAEVAPESPVILDIAPDVPLGDLIRVWDTCKAAKFQSIQFAADASKIKPAVP